MASHSRPERPQRGLPRPSALRVHRSLRNSRPQVRDARGQHKGNSPPHSPRPTTPHRAAIPPHPSPNSQGTPATTGNGAISVPRNLKPARHKSQRQHMTSISSQPLPSPQASFGRCIGFSLHLQFKHPTNADRGTRAKRTRETRIKITTSSSTANRTNPPPAPWPREMPWLRTNSKPINDERGFSRSLLYTSNRMAE